MIFDTDILIWYLRGNENAKMVVQKSLPFSVSCITYMELIRGVRNKGEMSKISKQLRKWDVEIIQINKDISSRATFLIENYTLSHGLDIADALIAATAIQARETLCTANDRHYRFILNLQLKVYKVIPEKK